jgi:TRAP-type mannitol/chloroaromatic compound transport system permease small subunit
MANNKEIGMVRLLAVSHVIDRVNAAAAVVASWLVLLACLISAGNAASRYLFSASSNAWLEIQWQMFAGIFLLGAPYVLKLNEHVRVDIFYGSRSDREKLWIDVFGLIFFYFPVVIFVLYMAWPFFTSSFESGETSSNAGGLVLWPVKSLLPLGFALLFLQGISELVKRIAALRGEAPAGEIAAYEKPLQ